jgi:hypothetical protein
MRELHGWHEANRDPRRHAHDAVADTPGKHARDAPKHAAHDSPKHAAHDSPKFKVLLDPAVRVAESLRSQRAVQEYEAKHAAGKSKPDSGDQDQGLEQLKPKPGAAEHKETDNEAKAALAEVDDRTLPKPAQVKDVTASQKGRVSDKGISYMALLGSYIVKTTAEYVSVIPPHLAGDIAGGLIVLAAGILLRREKHRKDGNADRPQD